MGSQRVNNRSCENEVWTEVVKTVYSLYMYVCITDIADIHVPGAHGGQKRSTVSLEWRNKLL